MVEPSIGEGMGDIEGSGIGVAVGVGKGFGVTTG